MILTRELTDLVKDVPLPQTPDTLKMQPWDRDHIHRLFDDLGADPVSGQQRNQHIRSTPQPVRAEPVEIRRAARTVIGCRVRPPPAAGQGTRSGQASTGSGRTEGDAGTT